MKATKEVQRKVLDSINADGLINLLSELVQFNSVVENEGAEVAIAPYVADFFKKLGVEVKIVDLPDVSSFRGIPKGPHPQVLARIKGSAGKPVFMVGGHLDTEPVVNPEKWTHEPFSGDIDYEKGYVYGVGTVNMKQSVASFMEAIAAIVRSGVRLKGDLLFAGWSVEDLGLIGSRYMASHWDKMDMGPLPDSVLDGEATNCSAWTTNVGGGVFVITTYGRLSHYSSRYINLPVYREHRQINAVDKMLKIMNEMKDVKKNFVYEKGHFLGDPVMSFGKILTKVPGGGERACLGSDECKLWVDIRFPAGMTPDSCKRDLERIIYRLSVEDPELTATVETSPPPFGVEWGPLLNRRDLPLIKTLEETHKEVFGEDLIVDIDSNGTTNNRDVDWCRYGGSDLSSFQFFGVPGINYGAGAVPVCPDERVSIDQLIKHCKVVALTILEMCELE